MAKTVENSKLVDKKAVPSFKPRKSQFNINFITSLHKFSNLILVNYSSSYWNKKWTRQWIWEFSQSKSGFLCIGQKVHFSVENGLSFKIENFCTYLSIFHYFRNWASFSLHFWTIEWMLQPLIANGKTTIFKMKVTVCA